MIHNAFAETINALYRTVAAWPCTIINNENGVFEKVANTAFSRVQEQRSTPVSQPP